MAAAHSRAKADARETKIRVQYDAPSEDTVRATVAVEWTREIPVNYRESAGRVVEVVFARTLPSGDGFGRA